MLRWRKRKTEIRPSIPRTSGMMKVKHHDSRGRSEHASRVIASAHRRVSAHETAARITSITGESSGLTTATHCRVKVCLHERRSNPSVPGIRDRARAYQCVFARCTGCLKVCLHEPRSNPSVCSIRDRARACDCALTRWRRSLHVQDFADSTSVTRCMHEERRQCDRS